MGLLVARGTLLCWSVCLGDASAHRSLACPVLSGRSVQKAVPFERIPYSRPDALLARSMVRAKLLLEILRHGS